MTTRVLGVSAHYHDAAAAMVVDGEIVAAAEEERFTRRKHDASLPVHAINACLERAWCEGEDLDAIVYYDDPVLTIDRVLTTSVACGVRGGALWWRAAQPLLGAKLRVADQLRAAVGAAVPVWCTHHHLSHAASAFYPSPFEEAAILTVDGVGEWATTSIGHGRGRDIELTAEIRWPHSLGMLYAAFTSYCGFKVNSGEYKLMGLAAYGRPAFEKEIREHVVHLHDDGSFRLDLSYFDFLTGRGMTSPRFHDLFGGPPRRPESPLHERHADLAASVQAVVEDAVLRLAEVAVSRSGCRELVMAGGVALNCTANGALARSGSVDELWVQPAATDAGGALGAALVGAHLGLGAERPARTPGHDGQGGSRLGPSYGVSEIRAFLEWEGASFEHVPSSADRAERVARALASGRIVAWFDGSMEFGPRALGGRSFLADPRHADMRERVNETVKRRESFRPFAPSVLADRAGEWFELVGCSPYMLRTVTARRDAPVAVPAVVHVDGTARVQTVDDRTAPRLAELLRAFERRTGCPVLLNTSFNVRGEPIVATPLDAYRCFVDTSADLLVLDEFLLERTAQPTRSNPVVGGTPDDLD